MTLAVIVSGCGVQNSEEELTTTPRNGSEEAMSDVAYVDNVDTNVQKENEDVEKPKETPMPFPKLDMPEEELEEYLSILGISSYSAPEEWGPMYVGLDWDNQDENVYFNSAGNTVLYKADSGRRITLGFENFFLDNGWDNPSIVYQTYDFSIGAGFNTYATESDYQSVEQGSVEYKWHSRFEAIEMITLFAFEDYSVAVVYQLEGDYTENYEQVIEDLYAGVYLEADKAKLKLMDEFVASLEF